MSQDQIFRLKATATYLGLSLSTVNRLPEKDPTFPKKIKIAARCVGYRKSDLDDWLKSREVA